MPRFVLLYHDCPAHYVRSSHWDLMLECGGTLRTWALARLPNAWTASRQRTAAANPECAPVAKEDSVGAERLGDHRLDYLDKEGSLGGDRGCVLRIESGTYEIHRDSPGFWQLALSGDSWKGQVTLQQSAGDDAQWTLTARPPAG